MKPIVSIIMGSTSDLPVMEKAAKLLDEMQVPFEMNALSAHRTYPYPQMSQSSSQYLDSILDQYSVSVRYIMVNRLIHYVIPHVSARWYK